MGSVQAAVISAALRVRVHAVRQALLMNQCNNITRILSKRQWGTEGGGVWGVQPPIHPEISKDLQNRVKLNPIVKTVKNC